MLFPSCEKDDTATPIQPEQNLIKTVSPENAINYLNSFKKSKSKSSGNYVVAIGDTVLMEDITNSAEKLAVIPAKTIHRNLKSRILLLEIDGKVESVVFSTHAYDSSTEELFSGEILITDLEGNFINGLEIIKGKARVQYLNPENNKSKNSFNKNTVDENYSCSDCNFSECDWCQLEEVVITATPSADNYTLSMDLLYFQGSTGCEVGCDNYWNFSNDGGGGGGSPTTSEEDKIDNQLTGKADCVYQKMVDNNSNINWILENFKDGDQPSQFDLVFKMSTSLLNTTNASTTKSGNTFIIEINANTLSSRTTLGLARTIIHEGIHARLREFAVRKGSNSITFPGVYEYYRIYQKNWDHQQMADFYRGTIAKGLKQFDNGQHSDQFYDDMAWEGLANIVDANNKPNEIYTEAWEKLTIAEQNRIKNTIINEKSNGNKTCIK